MSGGAICDGYMAEESERLGPIDPWVGKADFRRTHPYPVLDAFRRYDEPAAWVVAWFSSPRDADLLCTTIRAQKMAGVRR